MSISAGVTLIVVLFAVLALLAARAGIRSIQSARTVVFYRTRQAYTNCQGQHAGLGHRAATLLDDVAAMTKVAASKTGANPNFGMNMPLMSSAFDTAAWLNAA